LGFYFEAAPARGARKQGPKLSTGRIEKVEDARTAKRLWSKAGRKGLRGEARYTFVRQRMRQDVRMDPGWLKKLLRRKG